MSDESEAEEQQIRLRKDGTLYQRVDHQEVVIAKYDEKTGHLEFETKEYSVKFYPQVTAKIGSTNKGTQPSNKVIRTMGIKGEERTDPKLLAKRPKIGPTGDLAYEQAKYYLENDRAQFDVRYGPYKDASGQYVRKNCRRVYETTVDLRADDIENDDLPWMKAAGKGTREKTPIFREAEPVIFKNVIVARRGTERGVNGEDPITCKPEEVVGGFTANDDFEEPVAAAAPEGDE